MLSRRAFGVLTGGALMLQARRPDQYERPQGLSGAAGFPSSSARKEPLVLQQNTATTFPAGVGVTVFNNPFSGVSYQVSMDFLSTAPPPTTPFVKISMIWSDHGGPNKTVLGLQHWFVLITNVAPASGNTLVTGRGPAEAGFLQVIVKNLDASDVTGDFMLVQSGLPQTSRHDWRSISNNISGTYTFNGLVFSTPDSDCANNMLGAVAPAPNLPHGGGIQRINGLYAGEVQLTIQLGLALNPAVLQVFSIDPEFALDPTPQIYPNTSFTTSAFVTDLTLPRNPCIIAISNNDPAVNTSCSYTLIPKEFAS